MGLFEEIEVTSLGQLIDKITPPEPDPASGRHRNYAVYRGVADENWTLLSSLDRLGGCDPAHTKAHLEEHIFRNFMRYARPFASNTANDWELLLIAQHHGLPTRLLDWTYSPLVAAHFATLQRNPERNRVIWRLDWRTMHEHFKLKPLAFLVSDLDEALSAKGYKSVWDLFNSKDNGQPFVCMLEPPAINERILSQNAAFTLSSTKTLGFDEILKRNGLTKCLTKFVIPAKRADFFRDQLDICNVDERRLFPDLDGIASEIKRYYAAGNED